MLYGVANTACNINGTWSDKPPSCIVQSRFNINLRYGCSWFFKIDTKHFVKLEIHFIR